jgi:hypothetical protein
VGSNEQENIQHLISLMKLASRSVPLDFSAEKVKQAMSCGGRYGDAPWDNAGTIDWELVEKFASRK